jgi:elongation factor P--(R)-beta-lysine ligase
MMDLELLQFRSKAINHIRSFFLERNYLELDTPSLSPFLIPETCLEVFETKYLEPWSGKEQNLYLVPSPEVYIKQIIAAHKVPVFQISKCYRNVESVGKTHSPEFTMLEYYTMEADYNDSLLLTQDLFLSFANLNYDIPSCMNHPFTKLTMSEAFRLYAGFYLDDCKTSASLAEKAQKLSIHEPSDKCFSSWAWDDLYELIFVHCVEPSLPKDKMTVLTDYPALVPCLAQNADDFHKQRWELYGGGLEIANCYSEETSPLLVKEYFEKEGSLKQRESRIPHNIDTNYWKIFNSFPRCSGVALGFDRLLMLLTKRSTIDAVIPFPLK